MEVWQCAVRESCSMTVLLWLALTDKKHLEIKKSMLCVAVIILLLAGCFTAMGLESRLGGAAFGIVILLFCRFSEEALGFADGIIIFVCGIAFGLHETVTFCFFSAVYAGIYSAILLMTHKVGRKSRIPFLPFLLLGYVTKTLLVYSG